MLNEITELDKMILEALSIEEWFARKDIAPRMGVPFMNSNDIERLERLVTLGLVERKLVKDGKVKSHFEYRRMRGVVWVT